MKFPNKNSVINDEIKTKFPFIIKKLNNKLTEIRDDVLDKKNSIIKLGKEIKNNLEQNDRNREEYLKSIKSENIFFINKKWIINFISFMKIYQKKK